MDRKMIYPGQIPLETDLLDTNRFALIGLGKLAAAVLGTSTLVNGLACTPTAPASMQVQVAPGEIYSLQNLDDTAYSSLAADTTHQILKQGLMMDAATLSCPAPATNGQSINYLVQATYQDTDANAVVLPYYNASNPTQAYSGPAGSGTAQNTVRKGVCNISVKAGIAATTGTQTTPTPDSGYVGLFVVTVAYGQSTITSGNITTASGAPFINSTLLGLAPAFTAIPTSPTPSQFDNSTKSATTAFVRGVGVQAGGVQAYGGTQVLTAADVGKFIYLGGTGNYAVALPLSTSLPAGSMLIFFINPVGVSLTCQGADRWQFAGGTPTSISTISGDTVIAVTGSNGDWYLISGSVGNKYAGGFSSSFSGTTGWKKYPDQTSPTGYYIEQWFPVTTTVFNNGLNLVNLPVAYPNAHMFSAISSSHGSAGTFGADPYSKTQVLISNSAAFAQLGYVISKGY